MTTFPQAARVRYIVDDVSAAVTFYTDCLGFEVALDAAPAFAEVRRGALEMLLSGPASSGYRATPDDHSEPGRNRINLVVEDLDREVRRLTEADAQFRSAIVSGPGGRQILLADPAGNLVELFQPVTRP
jgi:predicted enzyme related to lactoylglutathione lyase